MLITKDDKLLAIEELTWADLVTAIALHNPNLAEAMKLINNTQEFVFYKASYRFGDKIINDGQCYLPLSDGGCIAFDDSRLPSKLRNDLYYRKTEDPLGLIISKNSELYLFGDDGVQPQAIMHPGQMFGIPKAIDNNSRETSTSALEFNLNAGSRSLFMLSKISDQIAHSKIQEHYGTKILTPTSPQEHYALFVDIANKANCPWRCEIIFFPRKWINKLKSFEWAALANCLMHTHRDSYSIWHKVSEIWNKTFSEIEREKKLIKKYPMQSIITAKQLFMFAANITPGFRPAINDHCAPVSLILDAYTNVYDKLTRQNHKAIIMEPAKLSPHSKYPIYYSINHPISIQDDLEASKNKSQIATLDEIRRITATYTKTILENKQNVLSLYNIANKTLFSYYHSNPDHYNEINSATSLALEDKRFTNGNSNSFPVNSQFFKGCIKIGHAS